MKIEQWQHAIADWADAADPGGLRRRNAGRAALAALTAWLATRLATTLIAGQPRPSISLFAVLVCILAALIVVDARRAERRATLLLSTVMFAAALLLVSLLHAAPPLYPAVLLALIFASYLARRRGLRQGELVLILTMGTFSAANAGVTWATLPWYLLAAVMGVGSLLLWQLVLLPYDPALGLRASVRSFYDRAAALVAEIGAGFGDTLAPPVNETRAKELNRRLRQLKLSRNVIESQFLGVLAPGGWQRDQIRQLQLALYTAEQGLVQMVDGARERAQLNAIPGAIRGPLADSVRALQAALAAGSQASLEVLAQQGELLQTQVRQFAAMQQASRQAGEAPLPAWAADTLRIASGGRQVAQSIRQVRGLMAETERLAAQVHAADEAGQKDRQSSSRRNGQAHSGGPSGGRSGGPSAPTVRVLGRYELHPTTVLGLQAVLATGLAMLLARLLQIDHANWVFWTAFVVIAGSSGESIRRVALRVLGTVGGVTIGVVLALLLPADTLFVAAIATVCIFLTVYFRPTSYPSMVFWLNIGFVMVYLRLGAPALDILVSRPFTALLGGLVAAGVVLFVFPVSIAGRFKTAAAQFLGAVDEYVAAFVARAGNDGTAQRLEAAHAAMLATYAKFEQTLPSVAFDNFPMLQADSPLAQQGTQLAALEAEVGRLALAATDPAEAQSSARLAASMRRLQGHIHQAIQAAAPCLGQEQGRRSRPAVPGTAVPAAEPGTELGLAPIPSAPAGQAAAPGVLPDGQGGKQESEAQWFMQDSAGLALVGIYHIVRELAAATGKQGPLQSRRT